MLHGFYFYICIITGFTYAVESFIAGLYVLDSNPADSNSLHFFFPAHMLFLFLFCITTIWTVKLTVPVYVVLHKQLHTHTHNRFTAFLEYVRDHPGKQVPER